MLKYVLQKQGSKVLRGNETNATVTGHGFQLFLKEHYNSDSDVNLINMYIL